MSNPQNEIMNVLTAVGSTRIVVDWQDTLSMNVEFNGNFHVQHATDFSNAKNTFVVT